MKYEFTQPFAGFATGETKDADESIYIHNVSILELERIGVVKKVEEPKRPKFRVGDYAMHVNGKVAVKIHSVLLTTDDDNEYKYAYADNRWKYESVLRTPTKEELELYFR